MDSVAHGDTKSNNRANLFRFGLIYHRQCPSLAMRLRLELFKRPWRGGWEPHLCLTSWRRTDIHGTDERRRRTATSERRRRWNVVREQRRRRETEGAWAIEGEWSRGE